MTWSDPDGYPNSLALCVVDAIQSIGIRYATVEKVVRRYRAYRKEGGADPETDGLGGLLASFHSLGGAEQWASVIGTRNRTSSRAGILKAEAIYDAALSLTSLGEPVMTTQDLRGAAGAQSERLSEVHSAWTRVPGQRSGISWSYLLMLSGQQGIKPDRRIRAFVARAIGTADVGTDIAVTIVTAAAAEIGVSSRVLDHAIWRYEAGHSKTQHRSRLAS